MNEQDEYVFGLSDNVRAALAQRERLFASVESVIRKPFTAETVSSLERLLGEEFSKTIPKLGALDTRTPSIALESSLLNSKLGFAAIIAAVLAAVFALFGKVSDANKEKPERLTKAIQNLEKNQTEYAKVHDDLVQNAPKDNTMETILNGETGTKFGNAIRDLLDKPEMTNVQAWDVYRKSNFQLADQLSNEFFSPAAIKLTERFDITDALLNLSAVFKKLVDNSPKVIQTAESIITEEQIWARDPDMHPPVDSYAPTLYATYFRRTEGFWKTINTDSTAENFREKFKEFLHALREDFVTIPADDAFRKNSKIDALLTKPTIAFTHAQNLEKSLTEFLTLFGKEEHNLREKSTKAIDDLNKSISHVRERNVKYGKQAMSDQEWLASDYLRLVKANQDVYRNIAEDLGNMITIAGVMLRLITKLSKMLERYTTGLHHILMAAHGVFDEVRKNESTRGS